MGITRSRNRLDHAFPDVGAQDRFDGPNSNSCSRKSPSSGGRAGFLLPDRFPSASMTHMDQWTFEIDGSPNVAATLANALGSNISSASRNNTMSPRHPT